MFMCVCVMFVYVDKVIACAMFPCVRAQIHVVFLLSSVRLRHRRHGTLPFPRAPSSSYFYFSFVGLHFDAAAELLLPVPSHLHYVLSRKCWPQSELTKNNITLHRFGLCVSGATIVSCRALAHRSRVC